MLAASIFVTGLAVFGFRNPTWGIHVQESATIPFPFGLQAPLLPWMAFLTFLCVFAFIANVARAAQIVKRSRTSLGAFVSHLGLAMLLGGLILSRGFERVEKNVIIQPNAPGRALDYALVYKDYVSKSEYDRDGKVELDVIGKDDRFTARPGLYYVTQQDGQDRGFVSPYIHRTLSHDVYVAMHEPRIFVWEEPQWFKPGETKTLNNVKVKFLEPTMKGTPGQAGTEFGALVEVTGQDKTYRANPTFKVGDGPTFAPIGEELVIVMPQMNAGDRSVALQILFQSPVYPIDFYYKPLTSLVWFGAGILFLGGLTSAFYRRLRRVETPVVERTSEPSASEKIVHATFPAA
jgi:cytochrome c-type biogenesis protein CcmF